VTIPSARLRRKATRYAGRPNTAPALQEQQQTEARGYSQVTGERPGQAGWPDPSGNGSQGPWTEAKFTSSSDDGRALSESRNRNCAARSVKKPLRVESSNQRLVSSRGESQLPRAVYGCYCEPARNERSWRSVQSGSAS
jgi:hypothetical protein